MKSAIPRLVFAFILLMMLNICLFNGFLFAQTAGFSAPDTVCAGQPVTLVNTTTGGSTYYWNFCSGNANQNPTGTNIGNPGNLLNIPTYITLVKQGNDCFSFISNQGSGIVRYYHGSSFRQNPSGWTSFGALGTFDQEGIQVKQDNGQWYGFVCSNTKLTRLNFGTSLWNTPTATDLTFTGLNMLHGLVIIQEGTTWLGFAMCSVGNTMIRFNFGTSLANTPVMTNFGNIGGFASPSTICLVQENNTWYGLVSAGNNTLSRITFGTSLLNTPTGVNIGNPGGLNTTGGLTLIRECEETTGYFVNYLSPGQLGKLTFPTGITGTVTGQILGNIGNLDKPHSFSELFRIGDTLYAYITNRQSHTLTRLTFLPCSNASVPSSVLFNPPTFSYSTAGTYNVRLIVNEGLPTEQVVCKSIVVLSAPCNAVAVFTAPDTVCAGQPVTLTNQSSTGGTYYWNFCTGNTLSNPVGVNIGNPGNLMNVPTYNTLQKDGNTCYSFVSSRGNISIVRYNHGTSFSNNPVSWTNLGNFGLLNDSLLGLKICNDNGTWIGFVTNNNRLIRLNFGTSLANTPTASVLGPYSMLFSLHCVEIVKEGTNWIGFLTCNTNWKIVRINFGNSLLNSPTLTDLGVPGGLNSPTMARVITENSNWYCFVVNSGNNTLTRLDFGNSLLNVPVGNNLGSPCPGINPGGIAIIRDCESTTGFQLNASPSAANLIWRLNFPNGLTGAVTGTGIGNIGGLSRPYYFSELFREGDTLFMYNTNRDIPSLTRHRFLPCSNASVASSTLYNPPVFSYNQPGTYNVELIVNEGQFDQASNCKNIVVKSCNLTAGFTAPDTVCVNDPVPIVNTSAGGSTYYWNFCSGNAGSNLVSENIGNAGGNVTVPVYITLAQQGNDCFSFVTNQDSPSFVTRIYHGSNFRNNPVSSVKLLATAGLQHYLEGIQIRYDNGLWYGFLCNDITILRIDFGASLWNNSPTVTDLGPFPVITIAHGLAILKEGNTWLGFFDSDTQDKLFKLNFGTSLANTPVITDMGNIAGFSHPCQIAPVKENGICYLLITNFNGNTLSRINFGNSYLNTPTGQNLGNCGGLDSPVGITLLNDCEISAGYYATYKPGLNGAIGRLSFSGGIAGTASATSLGNVGGLNYPHSFSELFRQNDSIFTYLTNRGGGSLTRFSFPPCTNASIPSSTLFNPPVFSYNSPGSYSVRLVINEGAFNESTICKNIVAVNPPVVNLGPDQSICEGQSATFNAGYCAGCTYLWSNLATGQTNIGTGPTYTTGTAGIYAVQVSSEGGCTRSDTVQLSVNQVPVVYASPPSQVLCSGSYTAINLSSGSPAVSFSYTATLVSGTVTGMSGGFGNTISQQLFNPLFTPGQVEYSVTAASGNCFSQALPVILTVNPAPVITNAGSTQEICSGEWTGISPVSNVPEAQFTWTATGNSNNLSGFSPGNGNYINQQLFNSGFTNAMVTYQVVPAALGCIGAPGSFFVIVKPIPDVSFSPGITQVCSGTPVQINLNSQVSNTGFQWTATGSSGNVSNYFPGSGTFIQQTPLNTGSNTETVTYSVTPVSAGCTGTPMDYPAVIFPVPVMSVNSSLTSVCSGEIFNATFTCPTAGVAFNRTATASSASVTGYSGGTGSFISETLFNSSATNQTVTYQITPAANDCQGETTTLTVTVKPLPGTGISPLTQQACNGQQILITLNPSTPGGTCSWTASGTSAAVSGFSPGSGYQIQQNLFTTGNTSQTVTYTAFSTLNGCSGSTSQATVTTFPVPDITITPSAQSLCSGASTTLGLQSLVQNTLFAWTATGTSNISGYTNGMGNFIQQPLVNLSNTSGKAFYTITPSVSGCPGNSVQAEVTVNPKPVVTLNWCCDSVTTTAAQPYFLRGGFPFGGSYSGAGIDNATGLFSPSQAGTGLHTVSYSYQNVYGCNSSDIGRIRVFPEPGFTCGGNLTDVRDGKHYSTFLSPAGKCWMAENLAYGQVINDTESQLDNCLAERYLSPDSSHSFYQWNELMQYRQSAVNQGLCPPGWHIPTEPEWEILCIAYEGPGQAGGPLKDPWITNGFHSFQPGFQYQNNFWVFLNGLYAGSMYWTSTPSGEKRAVARGMNAFQNSVSSYKALKNNGLGVRCVFDK